jgi:hypothetical protein
MTIDEALELIGDMKKFIGGDAEFTVGTNLCGSNSSVEVTSITLSSHNENHICEVTTGDYLLRRDITNRG